MTADARRPLWRRWGLLLSLLGVALLLDGAYVAVRLVPRLRSVESSLSQMKNDLQDMRIGSAMRLAQRASDEADAAVGLTRHPAYELAVRVPGLSRDLKTVELLVRAGATASQAAVSAVSTVDGLSVSSVGDRVYRAGAFDLDVLTDAKPDVRTTLARLRGAQDLVGQAPRPRLDRVQAALAEVKVQISQAVDSADRLSLALDVAPQLLGADGVRRYVLLFQSPSEARGTGGLIGFLGVLEARAGRLQLLDRFPAPAPRPVGKVDAPRWYREHYGPLGAFEDIRQANLSPNFPVVTDVLLQLLEARTGTRFDGAIAMDPNVFAELTRATGPVRAPQLAVEVGPDNAEDVLLRRSYVDLDPRAQNRYLSTLLDELWSKISAGEADPGELLSAFGDSTSSNRLKLAVTDQREQDVLAALEMSGWIDDDSSNVQMVWHNQVTPTKVDYFLERSIDTNIALQPDGSAKVRVEVELRNEAPGEAEPSVLVGPGFQGMGVGDNLMDLHFLLPEGAQVEEVGWPERGVGVEDLFVSQEEQFPVYWEQVTVPASESRSATLTYIVPQAFNPRSDVFRFTVLPQTMVTADEFVLSVSGPPGYSVGPRGGGSVDGIEIWRVEGAFEAVHGFELRLSGE